MLTTDDGRKGQDDVGRKEGRREMRRREREGADGQRESENEREEGYAALPVREGVGWSAARKGANSDLVCRKIYNSRSGRERKKSGE